MKASKLIDVILLDRNYSVFFSPFDKESTKFSRDNPSIKLLKDGSSFFSTGWKSARRTMRTILRYGIYGRINFELLSTPTKW